MAVPCTKIVGVGAYVPERVLTNADLEQMVDTSDEWITERSGIKERRIAADTEAASDLAVVASQRALEEAQLAPEKIDAVIVATITPDYRFPATACILQSRLGAGGPAFDLGAACSGFVYSLAVADGLIRAGGARYVLVVGVETLSKVTDYTDRNTCVLFGDGAGAAVLTAGGEGEEGIISYDLGADGSDPSVLWTPGGGSRKPFSAEVLANREHFIRMRGKDVFVFAVNIMGETCDRCLQKAGLTAADVDLLIPHQANERITAAAERRYGFPPERVARNVEKYGNTSAASVPIALREMLDEGRIHKGDRVLMVAFGAGLTWGSCLVRWEY